MVAVTLALVGVVELVLGRRSDHSTPWSLLAPSLSALAVGLIVGRLAVGVLRPIVARTAGSGRLSTFLALRSLRRDRTSWRITAVVAMALGLLSFAVSVNRGAAADRVDRAGLVVGAQQVLAVAPASGTTVAQAVDRADPQGRWAMAAELVTPFGSTGLRTLAIDAPRLTAVAGWSRRIAGLSVAEIATDLPAPKARAEQALPAISDGDSVGTVTTLNGQLTSEVSFRRAAVLPQLLAGGSLVDLHTLQSVTGVVTPALLGTTTIRDQVWLGAHAPSNAAALLRRAGLTINSVRTRSSVAQALNGAAQPAGLDGYLAVGVLAAVLGIALLVGTTAAEASSARVDELALVTAGVPRRAVLGARLLAATTRIVVAAVVGVGCGLGTAHLTGSLIPLTASGAVPSAALGVPTFPAVIAAVVTVVPALALMALVVLRRRRQDAATARTVFT